MQDSLQPLPLEKWSEMQDAFKSDWPRSMPGFYALEIQRKWIEQGHDYGFRAYCPYGDLWNGMVGVNEKNGLYEIMIICPRSDTGKLEEALKTTKVINWKRRILLPFVEDHIDDCIRKIKGDVGVDIKKKINSLFYVLDKNKPVFKDASIPSGLTFEYLTEDHVPIIDEKWPHRYPGSDWYYQQLIKSKNGFGLYQEGSLMAWVFINEMGAMGHLYVLEEHRRKGLAELLTKVMSNKLLKDGYDVFAYCVRGNERACNLYEKLDFKLTREGVWYFLEQAN